MRDEVLVSYLRFFRIRIGMVRYVQVIQGLARLQGYFFEKDQKMLNPKRKQTGGIPQRQKTTSANAASASP